MSGVATRILSAMPTPVVQDPSLPSCLTSSRHEFRALPPRHVAFRDELAVVPYEVSTDGVWKKCRRRSKRAKVPGESRPRNFRDSLEAMGAALTQAKYLSGLFGSTLHDGWPVVWSNGLCSIFYPPARGRVIVTAITSWARYVNIEGTTREGGIQLCAPLWSRFYHIGDIPTHAEVQSIYDPKRQSLAGGLIVH